MNDGIGVLILQFLMREIDSYQAAIFGSLIAGFLVFSRVIVTLYIVVVGYRVLMGKTGDRAKEWAVSAALLVALQGVLFESSVYSEWVTEPIKSAMLGLSSLFSGDGNKGDAFGIFSRLDTAMTTITTVIDRLEPGGNFLTNAMAYIKVSLASLILLVFMGGLYIIYLVQVGLAIFSVHILFIIGGPFLFFAVFRETRFIAWTWFRTTLQYSLWLVLLSLVMGVGINGIEKVALELSNWDVVRDGVFTKQYALALLMSALVGYFLLKMSDISSALTGGTGMQSSIAGGILGGGINMAGSAAGGLGARGATGAAAGGLAGAASYGAGRAAGAATSGAIRAYSALRGIKN